MLDAPLAPAAPVLHEGLGALVHVLLTLSTTMPLEPPLSLCALTPVVALVGTVLMLNAPTQP